jgi:hypothetical protein
MKEVSMVQGSMMVFGSSTSTSVLRRRAPIVDGRLISGPRLAPPMLRRQRVVPYVAE